MKPISVVVVDDETLVASSLVTLLSLEDDIDVIACFASGEKLLDWWKSRCDSGQELPEVCVTDLHLDEIDGIEVAQELLKLTPAAKVMIFTSHSRPRQLKRALKVGVQGFMPKTSTAAEFADAIRAVRNGKRYIDPELAALTISSGDSPLTDREAAVIEAAGKGGSIEDIATTVYLAPGTTRNYLSSAMAKLNAQNRFEAFLKAREQGWI